MSFQLSIVEWVVLAAVAAVPYLAGGLIWAISHGGRFAGLGGGDLAAAILGAVVSWPVLLIPTACVA